MSDFEDQLSEFANQLHNICRKASDWNTAEKLVETFSTEIEKFEKTIKTQEFYGPDHEEEEKAKLEKIKEKAEKAEKTLKRIEERAEDDLALKRFVDYRINNKPETTKNPKEEVKEDQLKANTKKYKANKLSKLSKREQKLVGEIYEVIRTILPPDLEKVLIYKIEEKFGLSRSCE